MARYFEIRRKRLLCESKYFGCKYIIAVQLCQFKYSIEKEKKIDVFVYETVRGMLDETVPSFERKIVFV